MESQLRRGATLCRRVAAGALALGFVASMAVAAGFSRGSYGDGLSIEAFLTLTFVLILGLLLVLAGLLMVARTMEGVADLLARTSKAPAGHRASQTASEWNGNGWRPSSPPGSRTSSLARPTGEAVIGQLLPITAVVEHIRLGPFVKVTTSDGVTGWIRDVDLPPEEPRAQD